MTGRELIALSLLTTACGAKLIEVPLPEDDTAQTMVFGVEQRGDLDLVAFPLPPPDLPVYPDFRGDALVSLLYYDETLESLGLVAGPLEPTEDPNRSRVLPTARRVLEGLVDRDGEVDFAEVDLPQPRIDGLLLPGPERCADLTARAVAAPFLGNAAGVLSQPDGSALLFGSAGDIYSVTSAGFEALTTTVGDSSLTAVTRTPDGEIWVGGSGGRMNRGTLEAGFAPVPAAPFAEIMLEISAGPSPEGRVEVFALATDGTFARFHDDAWTVLWDRTGTPSLLGGIARIAPGSAYAASDALQTVVRFEAARAVQVSTIDVPVVFGRVASAGQTETFGPMLATKLNMLYRIDGDQFESFGDVAVRDSLRTVLPYRDGFGIIGQAGSFVQYDRLRGNCPVPMIPDRLTVTSAARFGDDGFIFAGTPRAGTMQSQVLLLEPTP